MARRPKKSRPSVLQLHVVLKDVAPKVWRRVLVPADAGLDLVHQVLNEAMGWTNSHQHQFEIADRSFADPTVDDEPSKYEDERRFTLEQLVRVGDRFVYQYDFGDGWEHLVTVEKELPVDERWVYPVCIGGSNACPPEDCGGPPGYERLVDALVNDDDPELVSWIGGFFDPKGFDVNRTNQSLRGLLFER